MFLYVHDSLLNPLATANKKSINNFADESSLGSSARKASVALLPSFLVLSARRDIRRYVPVPLAVGRKATSLPAVRLFHPEVALGGLDSLSPLFRPAKNGGPKRPWRAFLPLLGRWLRPLLQPVGRDGADQLIGIGERLAQQGEALPFGTALSTAMRRTPGSGSCRACHRCFHRLGPSTAAQGVDGRGPNARVLVGECRVKGGSDGVLVAFAALRKGQDSLTPQLRIFGPSHLEKVVGHLDII